MFAPAPRGGAGRPAIAGWARRGGAALEARLAAEREQLMPWAVVLVGAGILTWHALGGGRAAWGAAALAAGLGAVGLLLPGRWTGRALAAGGAALALGLLLIGWRAARVAAPVLERPQAAMIAGTVERAERLVARERLRLTIRTTGARPVPRVRVSLPLADAPPVAVGATVRLRAYLTPPPAQPLPGAHDFARDAWFAGIGATGRALGPLTIVGAGAASPFARWRAALRAHIETRVDAGRAGLAVALATGDQGAMPAADAEAMRRAGLTHLLSVSGLHLSALVAIMLCCSLRLLALSETLALRLNLVVVAAATAGVAGVGYTLLTGAEVPTVRSCIAALLVLGALMLGRDPFSFRLIAAGALFVMIGWPESVYGASFQMSFAAVTAIVAALHWPPLQHWNAVRDDEWWRRAGRALGLLLVTGLAVEAALLPISLHHFHKAGLIGVVTNLFAIPWTSFVLMPLAGAALLLDMVGLGAPLWWLFGLAADALLGVAQAGARQPFAVASLPTVPGWAVAATIVGGMWLMLWQTRWRRWGWVPVLAGLVGMLSARPADLLIADGGRHVALVEDGQPLMLRGRSGDFARSLIGEASGSEAVTARLDDHRWADCTREVCTATLWREGRAWRLLLIRARDHLLWSELVAACRAADVVVADRRLPRACRARWLTLDGPALATSGGISLTFGDPPRVQRVVDTLHGLPWWRGD